MAERKIQPVKDNKDKQNTYQKNMDRYNRALKAGFYFEALLIDYALIEDRLRSVLYHMAFFADSKKVVAWKKTRPYFSEMVALYKTEKENDTLGTKNISGKMKIVRCVLLWVCNVDGGYAEDCFLSTLKNTCESVDIQGVLDVLLELSEWCDYRNEVIHALLNKNIDSVNDEIEKRVIQGMKIARYIDSQVKTLKKGNKIRRCINASMN